MLAMADPPNVRPAVISGLKKKNIRVNGYVADEGDVIYEGDIVYVARVPTKRIMTVSISVGTRFPAYATSMGRVLLAELDPAELDSFLSRAELRPLTDGTLTTTPALRHELDRVRRQPVHPLDAVAVPADQQPPITFKVEVNYVEIDAVVTDSSGNFVRGLTRDDFEVLEDGKPQAIQTFSYIELPAQPRAMLRTIFTAPEFWKVSIMRVWTSRGSRSLQATPL